MRHMALLALSLLLALTLFATSPAAPVAACECPDRVPTTEGDFAQAEVVFSGRVIAGPGDPRTSGDSALLEVQTIWKGDPSKTTWVVYTPFCQGNAASYYSIGDSYLIFGAHDVYGASTGDVLAPLPCGRTRPLAWAAADLAFLGKGAAPGSLPASGQATGDVGTAWSLLALLLVGTGLALAFRNEKQLRQF